MKTLLVLAAAAALFGCRHPVRQPPVTYNPVLPIPPTARVVEESPTSRPSVEIDEPPPLPPTVVKPRRDLSTAISQAASELLDAYFPYDRSETTADAMEALRHDAAVIAPLLSEFPQLEIVVEGHCDERGSAAYNLGLGARRAERAAAILGTFGVAADRLTTISYGNERPQCDTPAESCWRLNRRAHLELRVKT